MTCLECSKPVAGKDDAIPGTGRKGSVYWCVQHESERIERITSALHTFSRTVACRDA